MTDFVSTWNEESFLTTPVAPLGLIAMRGTEDMGDKVNKWLLKWRKYTEETLPGDMSTTPGMGREDFLVRATCPRFGNGEGKGLIKDSVRGLDLYILCDVGAYNCTYNMYGHEVPMSPDDHYMDLKRTIAAVGGKEQRITVFKGAHSIAVACEEAMEQFPYALFIVRQIDGMFHASSLKAAPNAARGRSIGIVFS